MSNEEWRPIAEFPGYERCPVTDLGGEVTVMVTRLIRVEYNVPISSYDDMTRDQIREWETKSVDDPGMFLDDIKSEEVFDRDVQR